MALRYPKLATARFTRICPACGQLIDAGGSIAWQSSLWSWVHPSCYFNPRLKRESLQLEAAFLATVR
jgi:hypothetical protein